MHWSILKWFNNGERIIKNSGTLFFKIFGKQYISAEYAWKEENGVNRITEITKRDILDLFQNWLEIDEFFQTRTVTYNYYYY